MTEFEHILLSFCVAAIAYLLWVIQRIDRRVERLAARSDLEKLKTTKDQRV